MKKFSEIEYKRPDFKLFKKEYLEVLEKLEFTNNYDIQKESIYEINRLYKEFHTLRNIVSIRYSMNTRDGFYTSEKEWWNNTWPEMNLLKVSYYKIIVKSNFRTELEIEFGKQLFIRADSNIKHIDERIVEDRKQENKLCTQYSKLRASAKYYRDGKELTQSQLVSYKVSKDRTIRKAAADDSFNFFNENGAEFDRIFDDLTHLRDGMAKKVGLNNFVELAYAQMNRSDYTPKMVANFRRQVQELIVPLVEKLKKRQSKRIGLDSLKYYDEGFKFKSGNPEPKGTSESIIENAKKMFKELSPETEEFFNYMTQYELMDLESKKGKSGGGYCSVLIKHGAPFIFSNFNGTSHDIRVLIHEAGHAFQKFQSKHFKVIEYQFPESDSAEIHSFGMEFFTWPWMELFFKEDTKKYKFDHLSSSLDTLPYVVAVDEFQHRVYEKPDMTPTKRKEVWREMKMKYQPNLDYDGNKFAETGVRWHGQRHIFMYPFYYIDYALAQICVLQFWVKMQDDFDGAWKDYLRLCKAGGSMSFLKLVELAGLKSPFEDGAIEEVVEKVEAYLDGIDDSKF